MVSGRQKWCQVPFFGRPGLPKVFCKSNCATACATLFSEPLGLLRLRAKKTVPDTVSPLTPFPPPDTVSPLFLLTPFPQFKLIMCDCD